MSTLHNIALTLIKSVGTTTAKNLLAHFGTSEKVFNAKSNELLKIPGVGRKTVASILATDALKRAQTELEFVEKHQVEVLFYTDERYPRRLKNCSDAPLLLYFKGKVDFNHSRIVSIVGTRNATPYGKQLCKQLIAVLSSFDVLVISGLAYGIDVAAHKECVDASVATVGILGHGLDRLYPSMHKELAKKMVLNGGLLTEFPIFTNPDKQNFPKRNRIIAGIADATIVVEASVKGGALITAELANSYNKDVYAFPGRTDDVYSEGCNFLIKTNRAALINHARDLIYYLGWDEASNTPKKVFQTTLQINLTPNEELLLQALDKGPLAIDELSLEMQIPQSKLAITLLTLEMQALIVALPGKVYKLIN